MRRYIEDKSEQGSPEWYAARAGVITASAFSAMQAIAPDKFQVLRPTGSIARSCESEKEAQAALKELSAKSKMDGDWTIKKVPGAPGKTREDLRIKLATEILLERSIEDEGFSSYWMERGKEIEDMGRAEYELLTGHDVRVPGLIYLNNKKRVGASLDGLVTTPDGDEGNYEMKCPKLANHVRYMLENRCPPEYWWQVQGQMWVTKLKWCDFVSYHPEAHIPCWVIRVKRDTKAIAHLKALAGPFIEEIDATVEQLRKLQEAA